MDMALISQGAASVAVAHSPAAGGLAQVLEVGAIWRSMLAAESPEAREVRKLDCGTGVEVVRAAIARMAVVII
jgi:hypothetical protein